MTVNLYDDPDCNAENDSYLATRDTGPAGGLTAIHAPTGASINDAPSQKCDNHVKRLL